MTPRTSPLTGLGVTTGPWSWQAGAGPQRIVPTANFDEWLESVAADRGIGVVPDVAQRRSIHPAVRFIPLRNTPLSPVSLAFRPGVREPLLRRFVQAALAAVELSQGGLSPRSQWAAARCRPPVTMRSVGGMIEAYGLTKRYSGTAVVTGLTFTVRPGVVTGFLGPNGAGKSTTMRMILGLDRPSAGTVTAQFKNRDA